MTTATYEPVLRTRGWSGAVLAVDLTARSARIEHIPGPVLEQFVGGRGIGLWLLWNAVTPATAWHSPENLLVFSAGPLADVRSFSGSGKASVVTLSPLTGIPVDSSVGGNLGSCLAACGFDALVVRGTSTAGLVLTIDGRLRSVRLEEDDAVPADTHEAAPCVAARYGRAAGAGGHVTIVTAGRAAASAAVACLTVSSLDPSRGVWRHRQAGRGGIGRVFQGEGLRAIVVSAPPHVHHRLPSRTTTPPSRRPASGSAGAAVPRAVSRPAGGSGVEPAGRLVSFSRRSCVGAEPTA
jgi:aldehyde:ferredoxin oxidoreductase